uniref:Protein kinase domain-containing protein n=1 Tax=Glycine max TaxID=3847 RepID=K7LEN5_SOYBN
MDIHIHMLLTSISCLFFITLPQSLSQPPPVFNYSACKEWPYKCGTLSDIFYPFWGENRPPQCGGGQAFRLSCNHDNITTILIASHNFTVENVDNTTRTMRVVPTDLGPNDCSLQSKNISDDIHANATHFLYPNSSLYSNNICEGFEEPFCGYPHFEITCMDKNPILRTSNYEFLVKDIYYSNSSFTVADIDVYEDKCPVPLYNYTFDQTPFTYSSENWNLSFFYNCSTEPIDYPTYEVASALMGGFMICIIICCTKFKSSTQVKFSFTIKNGQDIESFLKNHGALAPKRYKFSEVKKMTNSFKVKLGEGGFGAVYKGELLSGGPVAVKILNESKGNGEDFINEVASISRTSHVNVVTLVGFCLEGRKKALIYEFMPNGSLDKFIYKKGLETTASLSWDNFWQIAIGIARGLEYLHRGCNTRILHFDIKPHNILLDENFCPKISDFGLAKLCPRKGSIISMSDPRGTIGYVAPEVWNRNFGGVSHKSDVYSYGMMLLEMVGGRNNINAEASHTSEIYFPDWIYKRLEQGGDLRPNGVMATEENEIVKRMTVVGLWCVQTFPKDRPAMTRVVDMLEGKMNSLDIPQNLFFLLPLGQ